MPDQVQVDDLAQEKILEIEKQLETQETHSASQLKAWFIVLKQIITAADLHRTQDGNKNPKGSRPSGREIDESIYADYSDDNERFNAVDLTEQFASNPVKWTIRVRAFNIVHHIVENQGIKANLDVLPDLIRLAFVSATSPYDHLKIEGFKMFKFLINRFAYTEEKEFAGHSILEQYKTQVISALKPAFDLDAPPYITAIASQVCCMWLCKNLEKDPSSLDRLHALILSSIDKLENQSRNLNSKLYTESELEQERLDILGSWAQLYIRSEELNDGIRSEYLKKLVAPQIPSLVNRWWEALKDYALLIIPSPRSSTKTHENQHVYTREVALEQFAPVWPKLVLACSICLCREHKDYDHIDVTKSDGDNNRNNLKYYKFLCGIFTREFCHAVQSIKAGQSTLREATILSIKSLTLLSQKKCLEILLSEDLVLVQELHSSLYCLLSKCTKPLTNNCASIRSLLQRIFEFALIKLADKPDVINHISALQCLSIQSTIETFEAAKMKGLDDPNCLRTEISTRICYLITIVNSAFQEPALKDAVIDNFKAILRWPQEFNIGLDLLESLDILYSKCDSNLRSLIIESLFESKTSKIIALIRSPQKDITNDSIRFFDVCAKSTLNDIKMIEHQNKRNIMMQDYVTALMGCLPNRSSLKILQELKKDLPVEFDTSMRAAPQLKEQFDKITNPVKDKPSEDKKSQQASKPKIALKADFSNFYNK